MESNFSIEKDKEPGDELLFVAATAIDDGDVDIDVLFVVDAGDVAAGG